MRGPFKAYRITDRIWWVGAIDWTIRNFHGYATSRGTTYNAYLVMADKITLMDCVKAPFRDEMLSRIASVIDPEKIDIIISNHSEMDHSGCLFEVADLVKPERVYASSMGEKALRKHFHTDHEITVVKSGDRVNLGNMEVHFLETRMLHWPDSMVSYIPEEKTLISQDAFGMHLATCERFADEIDDWILRFEAAKYYANILLPYSNFVTNILKTLGGMNLDIEYICPDHGPIWRKDITRVLDWYGEWAQQRPTRKAVVVYDSMWHSTELMARCVVEGLYAGGCRDVKMLSLESSHRSDVATEVLESGALIVGSPTLNGTIYPSLGDALYYLKGLRPVNKIGAVFSSFGWADKASVELKRFLEDMKIDVIEECVVNYVPVAEDLELCFELGKRVADRLGALTE